jgi:hypothetical protein
MGWIAGWRVKPGTRLPSSSLLTPWRGQCGPGRILGLDNTERAWRPAWFPDNASNKRAIPLPRSVIWIAADSAMHEQGLVHRCFLPQREPREPAWVLVEILST